jgi:hypothetical protein
MATTSIIDFLNSKGMDSSYANRAKIAAQLGIQNYTGTPAQNTQLLQAGQSGKITTQTSTSTPSQSMQSIAQNYGGPTTVNTSMSDTTPNQIAKPVVTTGNTISQGGNPQTYNSQNMPLPTSGNTSGQSGTPNNTSTQTSSDSNTSSNTNNSSGGSSSGGNSSGNSSSSNTNSSNSTNTVNGIAYNPAWASYGVTEEIWKTLNATQQASTAIGLTQNLNAYAQNANSLTMQDAVKQATNDPTLVAKYADQLGIDKLQFQQSLTDLQTSISSDAQKYQQQFENDRKSLAEAQANAGTAYSGFRGEAEKQLSDTESGVITSSKAAAQKSVNDLTSAFESKYGTSATTPATVNYSNPLTSSNYSISGLYQPTTGASDTLTGTTVGGITGSQTLSKQADINNMASQNIALQKSVPITAINI